MLNKDNSFSMHRVYAKHKDQTCNNLDHMELGKCAIRKTLELPAIGTFEGIVLTASN